MSFIDEILESIGDKYARTKTSHRCGGFSFCLGFLAIMVYVAVSLEGVEPTEIALIKHNFSQNITGVIESGGLHWVGISNSLIRFPSVEQTKEISLKTRSIEGLDLDVKFSYQWQYRPKSLIEVYRNFDGGPIGERIARNAILTVAGQNIARIYWTDRKKIGQDMFENLKKGLDTIDLDVRGFHLLKIGLPRVFDQAIETTEVTNEQIRTFTNERQVQLGKQDITNLEAEGQTQVDLINAKASAQATITTNEGEAKVLVTKIAYATKALKTVQDDLKFTNPKDSLMDYYYTSKVKGLSKSTNNYLICNVPNVTLKE